MSIEKAVFYTDNFLGVRVAYQIGDASELPTSAQTHFCTSSEFTQKAVRFSPVVLIANKAYLPKTSNGTFPWVTSLGLVYEDPTSAYFKSYRGVSVERVVPGASVTLPQEAFVDFSALGAGDEVIITSDSDGKIKFHKSSAAGQVVVAYVAKKGTETATLLFVNPFVKS